MTTKEIKIEVPAGYEIDREKSTFEKIVFKKKEVGFEDFKFEGAWISADSSIKFQNCNSNSVIHDIRNKNICISEDFAYAILAMQRLGILMASPTYNGDWVADWEDVNQPKFQILFFNNGIRVNSSCRRSQFLSFKTEEIRDRFLNNHRELIIEAKILL